MFIFFFNRNSGFIVNLISKIHNFCEKKKYIFNVLPKYLIITLFLPFRNTVYCLLGKKKNYILFWLNYKLHHLSLVKV